MKQVDFLRYSDILKALGHPVRLKIVVGLMLGDGCNVNTIVENLELPQSTVSQHLSILKNKKIITYKKNGVKTCYYVVNELTLTIIKELMK